MTVRPSALITRQSNNQTDVLLMHYRYGAADVFALPGGNPDRGETLPETVVREVCEELGVIATVQEEAFFGEMLLSERADDVLHIVFWAKIEGGTPELNPAETSALALRWVPVDDELEKMNLYPNVGAEIYRVVHLTAAPLGYIGRIEQRYFG